MGTDNGATDDEGDGCSAYSGPTCNGADDNDFTASAMCCSCGGGSKKAYCNEHTCSAGLVSDYSKRYGSSDAECCKCKYGTNVDGSCKCEHGTNPDGSCKAAPILT